MRSGRTLIALLARVVALAIAAPAADASGRWCNRDTCIRSEDDGVYLGGLAVELFQSSLPGWTQAHVWSSGGRYNVWSRGQEGRKFRTAIEWVFPRRFFRSGARVCAEGFTDGRRIGRPLLHDASVATRNGHAATEDCRRMRIFTRHRRAGPGRGRAPARCGTPADRISVHRPGASDAAAIKLVVPRP